MSPPTLGFSEITEIKKEKKGKFKKNQTYKNYPKKKVLNFLDEMESGDKLENFEPEKNNQEKKISNHLENPVQMGNNMDAASYYKQYVPYYRTPDNTESSKNTSLIEKLNYMIHLLEEQQDEKTATVTEELILYLFLGVFVIFAVDSFARAGKYTR